VRGVKKEVDPASERMRLYLAGRRDWVSQKHLARYFIVSRGKVTTLLKKAVKTGILEETVFHDNKYYRTPRVSTMSSWSYSSLKTFEQCPKKYYLLRILKDIQDKGSDATLYGQELHKAAEDYVKSDVAIPPKFSFVKDVLDKLKNITGDKHCELKLGVKKVGTGYAPCGFFDADVWWRGVADLVIRKGEIAFSVDYKTSKNAKYADTKQLDAIAAALFTHFPELKKIKSALAFVVSKEFIHKEHHAELRDSYFNTFEPELDRLATAEETGVWNASSGPLCKFCPVHHCEHQRRR
jgi:CRISPR/Cas system-associated exonuclease Cas4 (RecB family)